MPLAASGRWDTSGIQGFSYGAQRVKQLADDPEHAFPGHGQMKPEQLEIAQLKREVAKLKAERVIARGFAFALLLDLEHADEARGDNQAGKVAV